MKDLSIVSRWIFKAVTMSGIHRNELADLVGVSRSYISRVTNGKTIPSVELMFDIIEACGFEIVELRVRKKPSLDKTTSART